MFDWGLSKYGVTLHINKLPGKLGNELVIDVEDNESNGFVGLGLTDNGTDVYYFSDFELVKQLNLEAKQISGHNVKYDFHQLRRWGVYLKPTNIKDDTQLMAYTLDSTNKRIGLKKLVKDIFNIDYPSYPEIVGKGKLKKTLDKQDLELVANYCGMDVYSTWKLQRTLQSRLQNSLFKKYYEEIELLVLRIICEMEEQGVYINIEKLKSVDNELFEQLKPYEKQFEELKINPRSPKQILKYLNNNGINVESTGGKILEQFESNPLVSNILEYRKIEKLHSTYTQALLALPDLPHPKTNFNQTITVTGRLSSSDPINWQNIPKPDEDISGRGFKIRGCIEAKNNHKFLTADFSQIDLRVIAHFSQDSKMLSLFHEDGDLHEITAKFVFGDGSKDNREKAKAINFGISYGQTFYGLAKKLNITNDKAEEILNHYWNTFLGVKAWKERVIWNTTQLKGVKTLLGRFIKIPAIVSKDKYERLGAERKAISYLIQGSAADIMKLALIKLAESGYIGNITVHDEVDFILPEDAIEQDREAIKDIMENCVKLSVPLKCSIGVGNNWAEAKANG